MALLPSLAYEYTDREVTDCFAGYNHRLKIEDGEFFDTMNLSSEYYPLLATRRKRAVVREFTSAQALAAKEKLAWADNGTLYYDGTATGITGLSSGEKQLVSMGAYICVFPDKKYYNTADPSDYGSMEAGYTSTGTVSFTLCKADGTAYATPTVSAAAPENPENGELWIDTSQSEHCLRQYSSASEEWVSITSVYTKIAFISEGEIPELFSVNDGVTISGAEADVNGEKIIYALGGGSGTLDYIVVVGLLEQAVSQSSGSVKIERRVPDMEFVIESRNRLWGCHYGGGLNEIYCCALGDFKNWRQFMGLSTDSWTASVGSDGKWTGAVNYLGYPTFFKEDRIHRVTISSTGAHGISETVCRGVQDGSGKSLAVVNETLLYKSRTGICAYQGGFPASISDALGDTLYYKAAAGCIGERYYISMRDGYGNRNLFVYDMKRGTWMHEDDMDCECFARLGNELYAVSRGRLYAMLGSVGTKESFVEWMAESGILGYQLPDRKYVSRFNCRMQMEAGAEVAVFIEYDSDGVWHRSGGAKFKGLKTATLPIRPRRCDHMRIRLIGKGEVRIFSIARILLTGSDVDAGGYTSAGTISDVSIPTRKTAPEGTVEICENGLFEVGAYSEARVAVPHDVQTVEAVPETYLCPIVITDGEYYMWRE